MKEIYDIIFKLKNFCHCNEDKISKNCKISQAEMRSIKALEKNKAISCTDFSRKVRLSPSRSSRIIENLVKKGLLIRETSCEDRRSTLLYLTKEGNDLKKEIDQEEKYFEQLLFSKFNNEDIESIIKGLKLLEKLMENKI